MQDNLQEIGEEVAKLAKKMSERKSELLGRANTALQTRLNLEEEWMRQIRRPADFTALYQAESKSFFALAETFSAWIKTHPEFPSSFIKDVLNDPESKNEEAKIAFLTEIRNDRLRMLDEELLNSKGSFRNSRSLWLFCATLWRIQLDGGFVVQTHFLR